VVVKSKLTGKRAGVVSGFLMAVTLACPVGSALASQSERYLWSALSYNPVSTEEGFLHAGTLSAGFGYYLSDFSVIDGELYYGFTWSDGGPAHIAGAEAAFRLLIDATQWIPSVGPVIGWLYAYSNATESTTGPYIGGEACIEYRSVRERSLALCGEMALFPIMDTPLQGMYFLSFRWNGFLPYIFE